MLAEALTNVRTALGAGDWARALAAALTAWRLSRSTELADLVDRIGARCDLPKPPHTRSAIHRWWMAKAIDPDPATIGTLIATFGDRMYIDDVPWDTMRTRWGTPNPVIEGVAALSPPRFLVTWAAQGGKPFVWDRKVPNWVDRVAAMMTWPDDPRVASVLAALVTDRNASLESESGDGPWPEIADKLRALGDQRIAQLFAQRLESRNLTSRQRTLTALREEFRATASAPSPEITAIAASLPMPVLADPQLEIAPLWREVSEYPGDDGRRLVLADALLATGDNRGELIVLQCAPDPERRGHAEAQAARLIKREWERWMGPLALVLADRGTEIRRGMLDAIRVGLSGTPPWAWEAIRGHHELGCVSEVRPAMVGPVTFAKLVADLPRFPRVLEIDAHEVLTTLLETHLHQPLEEVYYAPVNNFVNYRRVRPPLEDTFEMLARLAPDLQRLDLGPLWWLGGDIRSVEVVPSTFVEWVTVIRHQFPRLTRMRIVMSSVREDARAAVGQLGVEWLADRPKI